MINNDMGSVSLYSLFSVIFEKSALIIILSPKVGSFVCVEGLILRSLWSLDFLSFFLMIWCDYCVLRPFEIACHELPHVYPCFFGRLSLCAFQLVK